MTAPAPSSRPTFPLVLLAAVVAVLGSVLVPGPGEVAARPDPARSYRPPTTAPVLDPYRPPAERWQAGNRGIEYGTTVGDPITAIGPGTVAFSGPVAGRLAVTVLHPDGLRSSYVGPGRAAVQVGERVTASTVVVVAEGAIHLGVRRGTDYLDPASLWGTAVGGGRVHLVPDGDRGTGAGVGRTASGPWSAPPWLGRLRLPARPLQGATLGGG